MWLPFGLTIVNNIICGQCLELLYNVVSKSVLSVLHILPGVLNSLVNDNQSAPVQMFEVQIDLFDPFGIEDDLCWVTD